MFNIKRLFALGAPMAGIIVGGAIAHAQSTGCYTLESLQGSYAVANTYGANVALGLQAEDLDGKGNLTRTGILNQPTVGSATGERTVGTVTSNGTFVFPTKIAALGAFSVSIATQPVGQICAVSRATGVIPTDGNQANVTTVACVSNTLGVRVSGLASGKTVTVGNAGVQIVVNTNGVSTFSGVLTGGTSYALTVDSQPAGQVCTLSNASGTTATGAQSLATLTCI